MSAIGETFRTMSGQQAETKQRYETTKGISQACKAVTKVIKLCTVDTISSYNSLIRDRATAFGASVITSCGAEMLPIIPIADDIYEWHIEKTSLAITQEMLVLLHSKLLSVAKDGKELSGTFELAVGVLRRLMDTEVPVESPYARFSKKVTYVRTKAGELGSAATKCARSCFPERQEEPLLEEAPAPRTWRSAIYNGLSAVASAAASAAKSILDREPEKDAKRAIAKVLIEQPLRECYKKSAEKGTAFVLNRVHDYCLFGPFLIQKVGQVCYQTAAFAGILESKPIVDVVGQIAEATPYLTSLYTGAPLASGAYSSVQQLRQRKQQAEDLVKALDPLLASFAKDKTYKNFIACLAIDALAEALLQTGNERLLKHMETTLNNPEQLSALRNTIQRLVATISRVL
jgi:hypothetical protein